MRILFAAAPGYGLMLPMVPLIWAARAAGHEVGLATTSRMCEVGASAGLPVVDVAGDRDVWEELMRRAGDPTPPDESEGYSPEMRAALAAGSPFGVFTLTMTEGTIAAGTELGADVVVTTSDHMAGTLAGAALGRPVLEVGNRVSWSMRDRDPRVTFDESAILEPLRARLGIPDGDPERIARIDPRAPSMGGLCDDEPDARDGVPWWPMRYVPYNGGTVVPAWLRARPPRPRVGVTLGTVVPTISGTSVLTAVLEALGGLDVDVVLAAGDADLAALGELPDRVRSAGYLPLSALLPSCSLLVHHGGSGTTAAPLFYGVPQLVLPSFADNPMSAERVVTRGVGLSLDPATADAAGLRAAVERLLGEPGFATAAREVRDEMAAQPSPAAVIARLEPRRQGSARGVVIAADT